MLFNKIDIFITKGISIIILICLINIFKFYGKSLVWKKITTQFKLLANKYKYLIKAEKNISTNSPIWVLWYQGINHAPPIVKSCINSIINNKANHTIHILTKYNLDKYIKLPSIIENKFNKGYITITHLSDIIRMGILYKYGGYWIDSTFFITKPISSINSTFYTLKLNHCFTYSHSFVKCIWSINFLAVPKKSFIAYYCYISLIYYFTIYNKPISYFLLDYIFSIAYYDISEFRTKIEELPFIKCDIFSLFESLNLNYDSSLFHCPFNKLNKRVKQNILHNQTFTNYRYIIQSNNMKNMENFE